MENVTWGELGGQRLLDVVTVGMSATVAEAVEQAGGRWVVITGPDGDPLSAVDPAALPTFSAERTMASVLAELPPVIVAAAETPLGYLVRSWMADEIEPESAFVAVSDNRASGVWAGADMRRAIAFADRRGLWDPTLPGEIRIPLLTRHCRYTVEDATCGAVRQFPERPRPTPPCDNPGRLAQHRFEW